jgi:hypothetical protein
MAKSFDSPFPIMQIWKTMNMQIERVMESLKISQTHGYDEINNNILKACKTFISPPLSFFLILVCEAIGTAATPGPLCQPRAIVKMIVEKQMKCRLTRETEVLGENLRQYHFCPSQNPT